MFTTDIPLAPGIEHAQQRRDPAERRAVADARGHGDHRTVGQAADDGRQRPLHARDRNDDARRHDRVQIGEQTVKTRHTDIIQACDRVSERLSRQRCLLRDGDITRAAGRDDDAPLAAGRRELTDDADSGGAVIVQRKVRLQVGRRLRRQARDEDRPLAAAQHLPGNAEDVFLCLALAEDDLRHPLTNAAVEIDLCIRADLLKGLHLQPERRVIRGHVAVGDLLQQLCQFLLIHCVCSPYRAWFSVSSKMLSDKLQYTAQAAHLQGEKSHCGRIRAKRKPERFRSGFPKTMV